MPLDFLGNTDIGLNPSIQIVHFSVHIKSNTTKLNAIVVFGEFNQDYQLQLSVSMHLVGIIVRAIVHFVNFADKILQIFGIKVCKFTRNNVLKGRWTIL